MPARHARTHIQFFPITAAHLVSPHAPSICCNRCFRFIHRCQVLCVCYFYLYFTACYVVNVLSLPFLFSLTVWWKIFWLYLFAFLFRSSAREWKTTNNFKQISRIPFNLIASYRIGIGTMDNEFFYRCWKSPWKRKLDLRWQNTKMT